MKPYPAYKDSGVEWLGQVPEGWEINPLKRALARNDGGVWGIDPVGEGDIIVLRSTEQTESGEWAIEEPAYRHLTEDDRTKYLLKDGDIRVTKSSGSAKHIGKATLVNKLIEELQCCYSNFMQRLRFLQSALPKFYWYFLNNGIAREQFGLLSNSTTGLANLSAEVMNQVITVFPPLAEQQAIASFLDRETAKIDRLIEEQRRLIALLAEKRQATISHAVTRGLNSSARLKPSGVDWLGDIPDGWEVRTISSLSSKITNGYVGPTRDILRDEGVRYIQSLHVKGNRISFERPYYVDETWSLQHQKSILRTQDVLIVQTGDIGQVAVVSEDFDGCNCHALIIISPISNIVSGDWLSWVLCSDYGRASLLSIQTGALHPHLNCGNVKFIQIPVPPLDEQSQIIFALLAELQEFDALTDTATSAITLLQERRAALISAAVTGKIDVRDLATVQEAA